MRFLTPCIVLFATFCLGAEALAVPGPVPGNPHVLCFLKREAQGIAERTPQGIAEREAQGIAERTPQGIAEREAQKKTQRKAQGIAERGSIDIKVGIPVPPVLVPPIIGPPKVPDGEFC